MEIDTLLGSNSVNILTLSRSVLKRWVLVFCCAQGVKVGGWGGRRGTARCSLCLRPCLCLTDVFGGSCLKETTIHCSLLGIRIFFL